MALVNWYDSMMSLQKKHHHQTKDILCLNQAKRLPRWHPTIFSSARGSQESGRMSLLLLLSLLLVLLLLLSLSLYYHYYYYHYIIIIIFIIIIIIIIIIDLNFGLFSGKVSRQSYGMSFAARVKWKLQQTLY